VVPVSYHDFFSGCATVAGALIGLLFVAISVAPARLAGRASVDHQIKAGTAFSALVNTLVISLVALLPGGSLSVAAVVLAISGLSSTAGLIVVLYRGSKEEVRLHQLVLFLVLLVLYALQLANGIAMGGAPQDLGRIGSQGALAIGFFAFAIARAWEIVGADDSRLLTTVARMAHRPADADMAAEGKPPDGPGIPGAEGGSPASHEDPA
jgi:hypothetical protein